MVTKEELEEVLRELYEAVEEFAEDRLEDEDAFHLACPCQVGVPLPHSLGCRVRSILRKARKERQE